MRLTLKVKPTRSGPRRAGRDEPRLFSLTYQATTRAQDTASLELSVAWVEFANVLSQLKTTAETLKTGKVAELTVNSEKVITLMRMITPEYFFVLALLPSANYGKARYELRITAPKLAAELL